MSSTSILERQPVIERRYLTIEAASTYSGLSEAMVRKLITAGRLRTFRPTRRILIRRDDLEALIESGS